MTAPLAPPPTRVLLVEDNPGDARLIVEMLRDLSGQFDLERVSNLESALERLAHASVDVVLLDLGLPDSQGLDTFERTRRGGGAEPIIVISGLDDEDVALAAVRSGAQDYLVKGRIEGRGLAQVIRHAIERQRTEVQLRWRTLAVEQSPAAIFITDPRGTIQYVNQRFTVITGYSPAEAVGQTPRLLKSGLTPQAQYDSLWATLLAGDTWRAEIQNRRKNGELYWAAVTVSPIRDQREDILHFLTIQEDITERKHSERTLVETSGRLKALMDHAADGIAVLSTQGVVLEANQRIAEILGRPLMELRGRPIGELSTGDAYLAKVQEFADTVARGGGHVLGVEISRPDGTSCLVDFALSLVDVGAERLVLSIGRDVTDQRMVERQLMQAQKLEAVGRLAGGIAHDFNNVLTAIFGYVEVVLEDLPADSRSRADLSEVLKAAGRAATLTRQLLAFSRQQVLQPRVLSVNEVVEDIEKMLRHVIGEDVDLRTVLAPDIGNVQADPGQLDQVLMNLVVNARDAMPRGGKLSIETKNVELTAEYADQHQPVVSGSYVMLAVNDTGSGMSPEIRARVFEPFFTTKEKGKGTGLGLSTVYGIVKQSGGYVWVYSEPGRGTTFKVYLPRVDAVAEAAAQAGDDARPLRGTETILVAEDDDVLRPLARGLLTRLGYTVLDAANPDAALALAHEHRGPIHLLLSDVVMPGASGRELARQLAESRPETRVLYVSGYTDDAIVHHGMLEAGLNYLQKPFTPDALARKVRDVLDAT